MKSEDNLDAAYRYATHDGSKRPRDADLRAAVNRIYYALFRALCECFANAMVGTIGNANSLAAWERALRVPEHGRVRNACKNLETLNIFPEVLREFAKIFVDAQLMRHMADYAWYMQLTRAYAIDRIEIARRAIRNLKSCDIQARRAFLSWVVLPDRKS